jgi:hypothetical protein
MAWIAEESLPTASMGLAAAVCQAPGSQSGQWVYAVGGTNSNVLAALAGYDTVQQKWFARPPMPTARTGVAAGTSPGRIDVLGGFSEGADILTTQRSTSRPTTRGQPLRRCRPGEAHSPPPSATTG